MELARYHIPLILVARDLTKLSNVAKDIETYYDIPCRILQADLNSPNCAQRIHEATTSAGLNVDILVNNAGVCAHGDFLEGDLEIVSRMVQLNIVSVTQLSRLYGNDMKKRRRGRILMVSSMAGVLPGNPSVAVYAATKAYEKSLASSLGREMERYGVGITCLLPGAVKDTSFASRSGVEEAACFHFPGYAKEPELVAGEGIKSLMLGYPESYPGWQNRVFVKTMLPMLPPRASILIGEWAWNPWQWGDVMPHRQGSKRFRDDLQSDDEHEEPLPPSTTSSSSTWKFPRLSSQSSNQIKLPADLPKPKVTDNEAPSSKLTPMLLADPVKEDVPSDKNTTISEANVAVEDEKSVIVKSDNEKSAAYIPPIIAGDAKSENKQTPESPGKDDLNSDKEDDAAQKMPGPKSLVLPPASSRDSTDNKQPPTISMFGFFDKDKPPVLSGGENFTESNESKTDETAPNEAGGAEQSLLPSMMDKKEYDFRDRRLDY